MSATATTSLAEAVKTQHGDVVRTILGLINGLRDVACELEMDAAPGRLEAIAKSLESDRFEFIVMGRFKNGKSTLLNALLGGTVHPVPELAGQGGPMVVDDLPATAVVTSVTYSDAPWVKAHDFQGRAQKWTFSRYVAESTLGDDEDDNRRRFGEIREFEMGFPAVLCQAGVTVWDSPGLDENPLRTMITKKAIERCDAAIVVYRSDVLMGEGEMRDIPEGVKVFTVVNLFYGKRPEDKLRARVWNKYVHEFLGGEKWDGQDLAAHDIHFVDAETARQARYSRDEAALEVSGLPAFEGRLAEFLLRDRQYVHIRTFARRALGVADDVGRQIDQHQQGLVADQQVLAAAYEAALPKLEELRERPAKLGKIVDHYNEEARRVVIASCHSALTAIRRELPEHLAGTELFSGSVAVLKVFQQKKILKGASEAAASFVEGRFAKWAQEEVPKLLNPIMDRFLREIEAEIDSVDQAFEDIHLALTGWKVKPGAKPVVGAAERVLSAVAGLALGDVSGVLLGGAGGFYGMAYSLGGLFASAFILGVLGITATAVVLPLAALSAICMQVWLGGKKLDERTKKRVCEEADKELSLMSEQVDEKLTMPVNDKFHELRVNLVDAMRATVAEEEHNLRRIVEL
ncbi:MAG TPA: dynamin family protein, partial [Acidimicrobiales bacterium]|nr:dynamin family protein [Acidimicrobiales bacterium]